MNLRLTLDFSLGRERMQAVGGFGMGEEWGRKAADRVRAQKEYLSAEGAAQLHRDKLRQEQGPRLWNEVREHVKTKCSTLNREYGAEILNFMVVQNSQIDVRFKAPSGKIHELKAAFEPSSANNALRWETSGPRINEPRTGACELAIKNDTVSFLTGAHPYTAESIAEKLLDDLLLE